MIDENIEQRKSGYTQYEPQVQFPENGTIRASDTAVIRYMFETLVTQSS
jgi:hypothetical protein